METHELAQGLTLFPTIGLILGMIVVLPFAYGFLPGHYWIQALIMLGGILWLTRGLHWDGWCDVWDAWGSGARGEGFFDVLKDSRAGAFGVIAVSMAVVGEMVLFRQVLAVGAYQIVPWALLLGRGTAGLLAVAARDLKRPGLAGAFLEHVKPWMIAPLLLQIIVAGAVFAVPTAGLLAVSLAAAGFFELLRLAEKNGGLNGDFLGAAVIWGELSALVAWNLTGAERHPGIMEWWNLF
jgi:adenosylcobinamide-GDP ribazoletransferase